MNIIFMGTPDFAIPCLEILIENKYNVSCVVTQPDKPKGRGMSLAFSPVKKIAVQHEIDVVQPQTLKDNAFMPILEQYKPDVIIVTAYGKLLPQYILDYPKFGCINIHASLLPKYRGSSPINAAIIKGDTVTGITSMKMVQKLDAGDIYIKNECPIEYEDDLEALHDRLSSLGAKTLLETLIQLEKGTLTSTPQKENDVTFTQLLTNENTQIDFNKTSNEIYNFIRGLYPFPKAYFYVNESIKIKALSSAESDINSTQPPSKIIKENGKIYITTKSNLIELLEIIPEGGKRMQMKDYVNGHREILNSIIEYKGKQVQKKYVK